jgi:hypothetical protein
VGQNFAQNTKKVLDKELSGRVVVFDIDYSDPSHVIAYVTWMGIDKKKLVEEASLVAAIVAKEAPFVTTIAIRGVDPKAKDKTADTAMWFEAKISRDKADRIEKTKIVDYAETRYIRLFDGVKQAG